MALICRRGGLKREILLKYSDVTDMDGAPFRPLAEFGISPRPIVRRAAAPPEIKPSV